MGMLIFGSFSNPTVGNNLLKRLKKMKNHHEEHQLLGLPCCPMVKISNANAEVWVQIPGQGAKIPDPLRSKNQNIEAIW